MAHGLTKRIKEKSNAWKGMEAKYCAKHSWIYRNCGKASKCEHCFSKTVKSFEWANISGKYKREVSDYKQLCRSCHRKWDFGSVCKRGHLLTKDNTYTRPDRPTSRICRKCNDIRVKNYKSNKN